MPRAVINYSVFEYKNMFVTSQSLSFAPSSSHAIALYDETKYIHQDHHLSLIYERRDFQSAYTSQLAFAWNVYIILLHVVLCVLIVDRHLNYKRLLQLQGRIHYFTHNFAHNLTECVLCNEWKDLSDVDEYLENLLVTFVAVYNRIHKHVMQSVCLPKLMCQPEIRLVEVV